MKTLLLLLGALLAGAIAASVVTSQRAAERRSRELARAQARWETERATLEARIAALPAPLAPNRPRPENPAPPATATAPAAPGPVPESTPAAVLERLARLRPTPGNVRHRIVRRIIHELEALADAGPAAIEPIATFLRSDQDVDYRADADEKPVPPPEPDDALPRFPSPPPVPPPVEFELPPTLRIGLFDTLRTLGGDAAERVLGTALSGTSRGIELAYLVRILDDTAPGKFREFALTAARDLLTNPPDDPGTEASSDANLDGLYYVLLRYRDPVFAAAAPGLLVTSQGGVNRRALEYLVALRGDEALPAVTAAWRHASLTNPATRLLLVPAALTAAGRQRDADDLLLEFLHDPGFPIAQRLAGLHALSESPGKSAANPATLANGRLALVERCRTEALEPALARGLEMAADRLRKTARGETPPPVSRPQFTREALAPAPASDPPPPPP